MYRAFYCRLRMRRLLFLLTPLSLHHLHRPHEAGEGIEHGEGKAVAATDKVSAYDVGAEKVEGEAEEQPHGQVRHGFRRHRFRERRRVRIHFRELMLEALHRVMPDDALQRTERPVFRYVDGVPGRVIRETHNAPVIQTDTPVPVEIPGPAIAVGRDRDYVDAVERQRRLSVRE